MSDEAKKAEGKIDRMVAPTWDLRGKQSVRTTFKLQKKTIATIAELAKKFSITQKEVFDVVCDKLLREEGFAEEVKCLIDEGSQIGGTVGGVTLAGDKAEDEVRKTYVLSQTAIVVLNQFSKRQYETRDILIELLFQHFKELFDVSVEREKKSHENALEIITNSLSSVHDVKGQLEKLLGPDDPVTLRFNQIMILMERLHLDINLELEQGWPVSTD
jgi:hypothetical protein